MLPNYVSMSGSRISTTFRGSNTPLPTHSTDPHFSKHHDTHGFGLSPSRRHQTIFPSQKASILLRRRLKIFVLILLASLLIFAGLLYVFRPELFSWHIVNIFHSGKNLEHQRTMNLENLQRNKHRERTKLVALITTGTNFKRMALMRKAHRNSKNMRYFFILGSQNNHSWFTRLRLFFQRVWYRDIWIGPMKDQDESKSTCVMVEDSSTTKKVFWGIREAWKRYDFQFLLRLGDDAYFRTPHYLQEIAPRMVPFFEQMTINDTPQEGRASSSNIEELNLDESYESMRQNQHTSDSFTNYEKRQPMGFLHGHFWGPGTCDNTFYGAKWKYALGMGYVMSRSVAEFVANLSPILLQKSAPEDAVFSAWVLPLRLQYIHDTAFHNVAKVKGFSLNSYEPHAWKRCSDNDLLLHYVSPSMFSQIDRNGIMKCEESDYECLSGKVCNIPAPAGYRNVDDSGVDMDAFTEAFLFPQKNLPSPDVLEEQKSLMK